MRWLYITYDFNCFLENSGGGLQGPRKFLEYLLSQEQEVIMIIITDKKGKICSLELPIYWVICKNKNSVESWFKLYNILKILKDKVNKIDIVYTFGYLSILRKLYSMLFPSSLHVGRFLGTFLTFSNLFQKFSPKRLLELIVLKMSEYIVMTNDGTGGDILLKKIKPDNQYLFSLNGVDKKRLNLLNTLSILELRKLLDLPEDKFIITNISRLASWKRVDLVLKAYSNLLKKYPFLKEQTLLLIVGDGRKREELFNLSLSLNLSSNVKFLGNLPWEKAIQVMKISDIITSFYEYSNIGNVLLESLSLGKIVFARNTGFTFTLIKDRETGVLLNKKASELIKEFPDRFMEIYTNSDLRSKIEKKAKKLADEKILDWEERCKIEYDWICEKFKARSSSK